VAFQSPNRWGCLADKMNTAMDNAEDRFNPLTVGGALLTATTGSGTGSGTQRFNPLTVGGALLTLARPHR